MLDWSRCAGVPVSARRPWCTVSHIMAMSLRSKWAVGRGSVSAGRRIGVSASGGVGMLFDMAIMIRRSRRVDDALQTPTHRYADPFPLAGPFSTQPSGPRPGWLFFRVARSTRMTQIWRFTASPARTALKNSQLTCADITINMQDGTLGSTI